MNINITSTIEYKSVKYPGAVFQLRKLNWETRQNVINIRKTIPVMEFDKDLSEAEVLLKIMEINGQIWSQIVLGSNVTLDNQQCTPRELYDKLPEDLVQEVLRTIDRLLVPFSRTDETDEGIIEEARHRIEEAEKRIAERKNSELQSLQPTKESFETADAATKTIESPTIVADNILVTEPSIS